MVYQFKTLPFKHQLELHETRLHEPAWGLLWEQGCGKSKAIIDAAADLYEQGKIDCLLVVAPNGVHRNWVTDEIEAHMPERLLPVVRSFFFQSQKKLTQWHKREADAIVKHKGLAVITISFDAFMTKIGKDYMWKVLRQRRCLYAIDEAHNIKTPGAKRTKSIVASGKYAPYRRILTGTPVAQGPFDIYSQVKFLDEGFWRRHGLDSFQVFKRYFGVWFTAADCKELHGYDPGYDKLIEYRNLDKLSELLKTISTRVTKEEVLDLPPKLYSKRYFQLSNQQRDLYEQLREDFVAEFRGTEIDGALAIVRLLRFQQITCGYVQTDAEEPVQLIDERNPRIELLEEVIEGLPHKAIIWCRFTQDIEQIMRLLGPRAVRYDGRISDDEAARSKDEFKKGDAQFFVANPAKGKEGLTLNEAKTCIYYSNSFKLIDRLQSEDRPHRIGQEHPVNYIDLIAEGTVDMHIVGALRRKFNIAQQITGDQLREWI